MDINKKIVFTPVAGAIAAALYPSLQAVAQDDTNSVALDEIIVTATKRSMSVQDIPFTIQALTSDTLKAMGAKNMEDYARFIPSVNVVAMGQGSGTVIFRGAITGAGYIAQSTSSVYVDEMSITNTGSQPQIRMVDINRVEALSGPQGTLYGSDAQAGTMRILTNKPVMNEYQTELDVELRNGSMGEASYRSSLMVNLPLVEDKLALRLVGFNDNDGGFIDNVFGHTPDTVVSSTGHTYPSGFGTLDNSDSVEKNWNDSAMDGYRASLRWEVSDNVSVTFQTAHQMTDGGSWSDYDPFVGDLQTVRFHDEYVLDEFNMHSLVLEADLGFAQLVASAGYYDRNVENFYDNTAYGHYWAAAYCHVDPYSSATYYPYYFADPATDYVVWWPVYCQGQTMDSDFFTSYLSPFQTRKFTQEIRLSGEGERFDWLLGFYYEDSMDAWQAPFATPTAGGDGKTNTWQGSISAQYYESYFGQAFPNSTSSWYSQSHTDWSQKAAFGELKWHLNDELTLTVGGRYFSRENDQYYLVNHPGGLPLRSGELPPGMPDSADAEVRAANNGFPPPRSGLDKEFIPKISLQYALNDHQMLYGLFTRGKRPGGVNRSRGEPFFPNAYAADTMDNTEFGYKSTFSEGRGRFNVTGYNMSWQGYQLEIVDPSFTPCPGGATESIARVCGQPWQQIVANVGDAHIYGLFTELDYALSDRTTVGWNVEFMEAQTDTSHDLDGDGTDDIMGGLRLPTAPEVKWAAWVEHHWPLSNGKQGFIRTQWSHTGDSVNILERIPTSDPNPQFYNEAYTQGDLRLGMQSEDWDITVFVNNITDERAQYTYETGLFEWAAASLKDGRAHTARIYTSRPREFGIRYSQRW